MALAAGLFALVSWQINNLSKDAEQIKTQVSGFLRRAESFISSNLGISPKQQEKLIDQQRKQSGNLGSLATSFISSLSGALVNIILVLVYFFLMLNMRGHCTVSS